jgi:hypothetical protein
MAADMREMQTSACIDASSGAILIPFLARYARFAARFKDLFNPRSGTKVHFVVGNHDVG